MPRGVLFWFLPFVFLCSFSIYLTHLGPTYQPDDSAETVAACVTLAPQHPSGYPLFTIVGHLFCWVPIGNPAFCLNLLAAGLGALLVTFVGWTLVRMGPFPKTGKGGTSLALNLLPAFGGAMVLALSRSYWTQCLTAKGVIYILQGLVFLCLVWWLEKRGTLSGKSLQSYLAVGLLIGLGFTNGWEMQVLFLFAILLFLGSRESMGSLRSFADPKKLLSCGSFTLLGASPLLLLPLRHLGPTKSLVWGDPRHFSGFVDFLSNQDVRQEVGLKIWDNILRLSARKEDWAEAYHQLSSLGPQLNRISGHLCSDLGLLAWIPLIVGVLYLKRMKKYPLLVLGLVTCLLLIVANGFLFLTPWENLWCIDKFFIPINVFGALCVGIGLREWGTRLGTYSPFKGPRDSSALHVAIVILCLGLPIFSFFQHSKPNDQSSQIFAYDYGTDLLKSLKRGAVFVGEGDDALFSVYFFQEVLGLRKDVTLVPAFFLWNTWGVERVMGKLPDLRLDEAVFAPLPAGQRVLYGLGRIIGQEKRPLQVSADPEVLERCYFALQPSFSRTGDLFSLLVPAGFTLYLGDDPGLDLLDRPRERSPQASPSEGPVNTLFNLRAQSYFNAAQYFSHKGLGERADGYYGTALEKGRAPRLLAHIESARGDSLAGRGKVGAALMAYGRSVKLSPEPDLYLKFTRSLLLSGNRTEALAAAQRSAELFPEDGRTWRALAACEEASGDGQKARLDLQRALELEKSQKGGSL